VQNSINRPIFISKWPSPTELIRGAMRFSPLITDIYFSPWIPEDMARLLQLPDELLLMIIRHLDPTSIQCLRHADRAFLRLFSDKTFRLWHNDSPSTCHFPWSRPNSDFKHQAHTPTLRHLLQSDKEQKQCLSCRTRCSKDPQQASRLTNEFLFCKGCLVDHPAAFFSPDQRRLGKDRDGDRICIGHQGYVRLCDHEVITWNDVLIARVGLLNRGPQYQGAMLLRVCRHPSHMPISHSPDDFDTEGGATPDTRRIRMPTVRPHAVLQRKADCAVMHMTWAGHLPLKPGPDSGSCSGSWRRPAAADMAARLGELRSGAAEYIIPQSALNQVPEMRCFDRNQCCCLDFGDQDDQDDQDLPVDNNAQPVPLEGDNNKDNHVGGEKGCRAVPSARLFPIPSSSSSSSHCRSEAERLGKIRAHVTRTALSFAFGIRAGWQASIRPCPATTVGCLEIGYQRWVACATMLHPSWSAADYSWFEALDPDSYRLCEDGEARGSLWCPDPTCTNYYRYLERPLVRKCAGASVFDYFDNNGIKWTPSWRIRGKLVTTVKGARIEQKRVAKELEIPSTTSPKVILHLSVRRERLWKWCGRKVRALFCTK